MGVLMQFANVVLNKANTLSFSINAGDMLVLQLVSQEAKTAAIDMALGDMIPAQGEVLLQGEPVQAAKPGSIGFIPEMGGLISNLKTWENVTLPLWYHGKRQVQPTEESVTRWLARLGLEQNEWESFMSSPAARLRPAERKMAGVLRGLVLAPQLLVIDAAVFDDVEASLAQAWVAVLEEFVREAEGRAVLVVANTATVLPWKIIK